MHRGPSNSARNRVCNCNKQNVKNQTVNGHLLHQKSFNGIEEIDTTINSEAASAAFKNKKVNSQTICQICNANIIDSNNLNSNLLTFSNKLTKFKREQKAAKNLAIVVGKAIFNKTFSQKMTNFWSFIKDK